MSNRLNPTEKFMYLSWIILFFKEPLCPKSMPKVIPLYQRKTGKVAPRVIPKEFTGLPSSRK